MRSTRTALSLAFLILAAAVLWLVPYGVRSGVFSFPVGHTVSLAGNSSDVRAGTGVLAIALILAMTAVVLAEIAKICAISDHFSVVPRAAAIAFAQLALFLDGFRIAAPDWIGAIFVALGGHISDSYSVFDPRWPWPSTLVVAAATFIIAARSRAARIRPS